jgi:hypothetical protein
MPAVLAEAAPGAEEPPRAAAVATGGGKGHTQQQQQQRQIGSIYRASLATTALLHGLYVGAIPIGLNWQDQMAGSRWGDRVLIALNSLGLNCEH